MLSGICKETDIHWHTNLDLGSGENFRFYDRPNIGEVVESQMEWGGWRLRLKVVAITHLSFGVLFVELGMEYITTLTDFYKRYYKATGLNLL